MYVAVSVEPLFERPPPLERPLDSVNLYIYVLISSRDERPPLLKVHFSHAKGVASQEGFHCIAKQTSFHRCWKYAKKQQRGSEESV